MSLALRLFGLGGRLVLTLYIARYLGLAAMASYGFVTGAAASMVAISGLGLDYRVSRYSIHRPAGLVALRVRDRALLRTLVAAPLLGLAGVAMHLPPISLSVVMAEPIVYDLQQVLLFRRRPLAANALLFARSAGWVPVVVGLGIINPHWRSLDFIFAAWSAGLAVCLTAFVLGVLGGRPVRRALRRPVDWGWLGKNAVQSRLVYLSELGFAGMVYTDRYVIDWLRGAQAAGVFIYFWSFTNAIVPLVQAGVFNQLSPSLSISWRERDKGAWRALVGRGFRQTLILASALCLGLLVVVGAAIQSGRFSMERTAVPLVLLMAVATTVRLSADWLQLTLWSAERDREWVRINIAGLILTPIVATAAVSAFGLVGAGMEMLITASGVLLLRYRLLRRLLAEQGKA